MKLFSFFPSLSFQRKLIRVAFAMAALTGAGASGFAKTPDNVDRFAFSLAVERFDHDQSKPMNMKSPEFAWMREFIRASMGKSPDFANLLSGGNANSRQKDDIYGDSYRTAVISTSADATAESSLFTKYVREWVTKATQGCPSVSGTENAVTSQAFLLDEPQAPCAKSNAIAAGLVKIGIDRITLAVQKDDRGMESAVYLFLSAPQDSLQLMGPILKQIDQVPDSQIIGQAFTEHTGGRRGGGIGESSFEAKQNLPARDLTLSDPISMDVKKGWGDCMAGCIYRHYWKIVGTPKNAVPPFDFDVQITESGSPVPKGADNQ